MDPALLATLLPRDRAELMALWSALSAYVENGEDACETPADLAPAQALLSRFDFAVERAATT